MIVCKHGRIEKTRVDEPVIGSRARRGQAPYEGAEILSYVSSSSAVSLPLCQGPRVLALAVDNALCSVTRYLAGTLILFLSYADQNEKKTTIPESINYRVNSFRRIPFYPITAALINYSASRDRLPGLST